MSETVSLDQNFWDRRWDENQTGWDIGCVSPAISKYINSIENKDSKVLIPGCGNAYEAQYLSDLGFQDIHLLDIAPSACARLEKNFSNDPNITIHQGDFFEHSELYDIIIEQTFFCALHPSLRKEYVKKMHELLSPKGRLFGLLFASEFEKEGPPFGGTEGKYRSLMKDYFDIVQMQLTVLSISPRQGNELFIELEKK